MTSETRIEFGKTGGTDMRIGMGYAVHRLVEGRKLLMGGVVIPYE